MAFILVGCESSRQTAALTADQAKTLTIRLANDKTASIYLGQPFPDGQPATFVSGHWIWKELAPGDIEATVKLAADGSTNSVAINYLSNVNLPRRHLIVEVGGGNAGYTLRSALAVVAFDGGF